VYRILTASADTYITNKIIYNKFRVTDANVGQAATLDLFKLYGESISGSVTNPIELSRALVKFDLDPIKQLTSSILDLNDSSFSVTMKMHDVYGGQTTPSNFKLIVIPLSRSFDEGIGRDIVNFSDLDSCNFTTASVSGGTVDSWAVTGANKTGILGSTNIDLITSGNLNDGNGVVNLWKSQTFYSGEEDLSVDVTTVISATLAGIIPDKGFRVSYSGTQEQDSVTRFVKRFASTQHSDYSKRPKLVIEFNDTTQDHHKSFFFNITGSLFLNNFHRGSPAHILSGTDQSAVTGSNCIVLTITSGSSDEGTYFSKTITGSQHTIGQNHVTGVYSASFAISEFENSALRDEIVNANSATFTEIWGSADGHVGYLTSSFVVNQVSRTSFSNASPRLLTSVTNMQSEYRYEDKIRFRVFVENIDRPIVAKKTPVENVSEIFTKMYYRVRDVESGDVIVPFGKAKKSTLCSTDSVGMYFDIYMSSLFKGRLYTFDFLIDDHNFNLLFDNIAAKFRVV
jgi:hypothetical protein